MALLIPMIVYVLVGALFVGISIPLVQGKVKPNPWYGFRVKKTMRNPDTWYAVNAYSGRRMVVLGARSPSRACCCRRLVDSKDRDIALCVHLLRDPAWWSGLGRDRHLPLFAEVLRF